MMAVNLDADHYNRACVWVSVAANIATISVYLLASVCTALISWKALFIIGAVGAIAMIVIWMTFAPKNDFNAPAKKAQASDTKAPSLLGSRSVVIMLVIMAAAIILQGILRDGVATWMPTLIADTFNMSSSISILSGVILPIFSTISYSVANAIERRVNNEVTTSALLFGIATGRLDQVANAALEGANSAIELSLSMAGVLCLWSGVMEVLNVCGLSAGLARIFRPVLRRLMPESAKDEETLAAVSANVSANLLGLGNAATPLGIRAARRMARGCGGVASNELCRLVVLNTASIQLLPATVASVRAAAGCATPFDILPAVWLASVLSVTAGLTVSWLFSRIGRRQP
jgi:spore maturation protein A